jgi:serine phosphatase RsbU (regulator of sigma subunit)
MRTVFYKSFLFLIFFNAFAFDLSAQKFMEDSLAHLSHSHTPWDILSGSGDDSIVCYKQAHRNIYLLVTGLIILTAVVTIRLLVLNKRTNKLLKERNALIEEKNKNITDSINYAKRIQQSLLPTEKYIEKKLKGNK